MKNNETLSTNPKNDNKGKGIVKLTKKTKNNNNAKKEKRKLEVSKKESRRKTQANSKGKNLNSLYLEGNTIQNILNQIDLSNSSLNNNIHQNLANKTNKLTTSNKKNNIEKKKQTVNLSKNIEEIIKRRIIDKNIKTKSQNKYLDKKTNFASKRTTTATNLKKHSSLTKRLVPKKKKIIKKDRNKIKEDAFESQNDDNKKDNKKYSETKRYSVSIDNCKNRNDIRNYNHNDNRNDNDNDNDKTEDERTIQISVLNPNTENFNNENMSKLYDNPNTLRNMNYDYDSGMEDDIKSRRIELTKSNDRSAFREVKRNINKDHYIDINYTYDTINPELIDDFQESSKKYVNVNKTIEQVERNKYNLNNENCLEQQKSVENNIEQEKLNIGDIINISNANVNDTLESKSSGKSKSIDIKTNKKDLSHNKIINSTDNNSNSKEKEKETLLNNSISEIKSDLNKDLESIKKTKKNTTKSLDSNTIITNFEQKPIQNESNQITEVRIKNLDKLVKSEEHRLSSNIVYAPKRITNHFSLKHNENNNNDLTNKKNNNEQDINEKERNTDSGNTHRNKMTYSKKLFPAVIYFQKNNISEAFQNVYEYNQTDIKTKKNKSRFKLNSSFKGAKNLQMNNIFMNNNVYKNNFNCPYIGPNTYVNTEANNSFMDMNNCYYNLSSNTNNIFYEINNPYTQLFFQMNNNDNDNDNENKNVKGGQFINLNNSFNNSYRKTSSLNSDIFFRDNVNMNQIERKEESLNKINFEDFIVLESRMKDIKNTLSIKHFTINECFEYLNYYYNASIYTNIDCLFEKNSELNNLKTCLGQQLLSIIICYNCSLDIIIFEQTYLLIKEVIDINYRNLILLFESILNSIISNNGINIKNNLWLLKMKNIINNYNNFEQNNKFNEYISLNENPETNLLEKIKLNTNYIMNNINIILTNVKLKNNEILLTIFKTMNEKLYSNIFFYFFNYILHIINYKSSLVGNIIMENHLLNNINIIMPYIKTKNIKKYSLVLDLEETLLHFNMNMNNNNEGVVDIRPGTIKFLDDISEYYELIVFNEGEQKYTDLLIDSLEQNKIYFEHRFYREHVIIDNNDVVKDLTRIGRALDKILIVDNMAQNFKFQKNNGIIIKSFWGNNPNDNILNELAFILYKIAKDEGDIRNGLIKYKNEIVNKITIGNKIL